MLLAGEIGKPHGLGGEVYVIEISDDPRRFRSGSRLTHADGSEMQIESVRRHRGRLMVKFSGVDSRESAETIAGALYVPASDARELEPDQFWLRDIEGAQVMTSDGTEIGTAARILPGAAQDLLVVDTTSGEKLVPMVKEIVLDIDARAGRITIDPPEGLFD